MSLPPSPFRHLLGYQPVHVIDRNFGSFMRNYLIFDHYLTIYGDRMDNDVGLDVPQGVGVEGSEGPWYRVQINQRYLDGRTLWQTQYMTLNEITHWLAYWEEQDRETERRLPIIRAYVSRSWMPAGIWRSYPGQLTPSAGRNVRGRHSR